MREGVRAAAPACPYAALTEADIATTEHTDGAVTMTGRVLCDEAECYAAAKQHPFDAAESAEARAAADWAGEKDMDLAPGGLRDLEQHLQTDERKRVLRARVLIGVLCAAGLAVLYFTVIAK
ncbi:hypothetical protein ACFYO5_37615 [Streptomyces sp. NPDC006259]|uniref:hypothetical protein n=1 Tax=Streptomyces sp. NPDC006259 TaxID=3364740 RepID=UPI0036A91446